MRLWICCWFALVVVNCVLLVLLLSLASYLGVVEIEGGEIRVMIQTPMQGYDQLGGDPVLYQSIFWFSPSRWFTLGIFLFSNVILGLLLARLIKGVPLVLANDSMLRK